MIMPVAVPLLPGDYIRKMTEAVYSVSEINNFIKHILEQEPELRNLQVVGEISNFKRYPSGHCYFTLKDAGAVLKCVMFRSKAVSLRFQPQNGDTVVAVGRLAVYERDGPRPTIRTSASFLRLKNSIAAAISAAAPSPCTLTG